MAVSPSIAMMLATVLRMGPATGEPVPVGGSSTDTAPPSDTSPVDDAAPPADDVAPPAEDAPPADAPASEALPADTEPEGDVPANAPTDSHVVPAPAAEPGSSSTTSTPPSTSRKRMGLRRHRFVYKNLTVLRYNPLGLVNEFTFGWRVQLVNKNTTLFKDSYFALKVHTFLNPAFGRVGPMIELQPLAVLNIQAIYNAVGYFKTFDQLQSFQSPRADASDSDLDDRTDQRYPGTGHLVTLSVLLQAKVGRVAFRDNLKFYYANMGLERDPISGRMDKVYYDQTLDILHPDDGWVTTNDVDLLYLFDFGLRLGARYTLTHAFYRDSMYLPGESTKNPNSPTHRVGPAILYSPPKWHAKAAKRTKLSRKRWYNPTFILLAQWWAKHRWRTGQDVSPGVPYIILGFTFEGDFWP